MKTKTLLIGTLMLGAFTACSDNDVLTADNGGSGNGDATGTGYVSLAISLPTQGTSSRAANDIFDDGLLGEYKVKDATLVLFEGKDEATATYSSAYDLSLNWLMEGEYNDQITSTAKIVQKVRSLTKEDNKFFAFVFLNKKNGVMTTTGLAEGTKATSDDECQFVYGGKNATSTTKFTEVIKAVAEAKAFHTLPFIVKTAEDAPDSVIMMSNAPLNSVAGNTASDDPSANNTISYLPTIDGDRIYPTREAAESNPATTVNVERAVAKVTLSQGAKITNELTGPKYDKDKLTYSIVGWTLDCTNKKSYLVRNLYNKEMSEVTTTTGDVTKWSNPAWLGYKSEVTSGIYRFVGDKKLQTSIDGNWYRIYWGIDPNYDDTNVKTTDASEEETVTNPLEANFNYLKKGTLSASDVQSVGRDKPLYCMENTFNVEHMKDNETTRAVVKVAFNGGEDFYIINGTTETLDMVTRMTNYQGVKDDLTKNLKAKLAAYFLRIPEVANYLATPGTKAEGATVDSSDVKITLDEAEKATTGLVTVSKVEVRSDAKFTNVTEANAKFAESVAALNKVAVVHLYKDGMAYYPIRIKHFGGTDNPYDVSDNMTPWNSWENPRPSFSDIYPGNNKEKNYLGRYGVLRNNWYDLEVTGIKYLGSPVAPEFTEDFDDTIEAYISVRINILSWALRKQSVEL